MRSSSDRSANTGAARLLAACAARLKSSAKAGEESFVWVDIGDGSEDNVLLMSQFMDISSFSHIYVVNCRSPDLLTSGRQQVSSHRLKWRNVERLDCHPSAVWMMGPTSATIITFSYSLSRMGDFMAVIDKSIKMLDPDGLLGVVDYFTSSKHDLPNRQHAFVPRWLWRVAFDPFGYDIGPERRQYLDRALEADFEFNGVERVPYVPFVGAPCYAWIGHLRTSDSSKHTRFPARASDEFEGKRPSHFPPTFLYSLSWEDPRVDEGVLQITPQDTVLTLTSGGCNALDLVHQGAGLVVSVDINPAQSYLLELKRAAILRLPYSDVWSMFGEGVHPQFPNLLKNELAPFLSQGASNFWHTKSYYFKNGLYYHGGMGRLIRAVRLLAKVMRQERWIESLVNAPSLEKQRELWFATVGRYLLQASIITRLFAFLVTNRVVLWFCAGVCRGQLKLIQKEDNIYNYIVRCLNSTAQHSYLRDSNYFYRCCLTGKFAHGCCPRFLERKCFDYLKVELAKKRLLICTGSFVDELRKRKYSKVILMDHVDWLEQHDIDILCAALHDQVVVGGRVIWRSASRRPDYAKCITRAGFHVERISSSEQYMDRVNMYASFYVGIRQEDKSDAVISPIF
ncbi:hypothetical protein KP509_02G097000 [Ceratopteris richardii]|uniref:Uncharacterized protein n=1 Tax=Ceratopteris richardii TaxID=49495 RepID=A0A8T2VC19_CERRI|nr:hypothetical protein KP509_02G097000 [Ceratopteris richardii]